MFMRIDPVKEMLKPAIALGFPYEDAVIHVFAGGSHQHGARLDDSGDTDVCGIYIPTKEDVLRNYVRGEAPLKSFVASTSDKDRRNKAGDADVTLHSLRRWAELAATGNPTVLSYLFMPCLIRGAWRSIVEPQKHLFFARSHATAFIYYGRAQLYRINGERGSGKHGQRDPLIDTFGFDTKAAMHMIRMMYECIEFLTAETMTFPRPEVAILLEIRRGEWTKEQVEREYFRLEREVEILRESAAMPEYADLSQINRMIEDAHMWHWE